MLALCGWVSYLWTDLKYLSGVAVSEPGRGVTALPPPLLHQKPKESTQEGNSTGEKGERNCHAVPDLLSVCAHHSSLTAVSKSCSWDMNSDSTACSWGKLHPGSLSLARLVP